MKKYGKRLAALLLAAGLSLTACGKKDGGTQQLSGMVYVPQFIDCTVPDIDYVNQGCADGEYLYLLADVRGEEKEGSWTDDETGEVQTYIYNETRSGLFRVSLETGEAAEMENYAPTEIPDGADGDSYLSDIQPGGDGTLWVTELVSVYLYDFPDDYDEADDTRDRWEFQTGYEETTVRRPLDNTGRELERMEISANAIEEKLGVDYVGSTVFDRDGNIYALLEQNLSVLDKDLNKLFELETPNMWGNLIQMADGSAAMFAYYETDKSGNGDDISVGNKLMLIDLDGKTWGAEYELNSNVYNCIPGGGDYLFYYQNNDSVYGWKAGASEGEKLFSWLGAGIERNNVNFFSILPDGRMAAVTQDWAEEGMKIGLIVLTPTDASTLPEKTTLTMASMYMSYDMRTKIADFNQNNPDYHIEVTDYSEYNTGGDNNAGLTRLNTEILAGHVPDMLYIGYDGSIPIERYAAKGILEDLWPYIEADTEIGGREGVMEHVLDVASIDGKLYRAFSGFSIRTVIGPAAIVGDRMSWTLADLQAAMASMPEGSALFGVDDARDWMLSQVLSINMGSFVDWNEGKCYFDTDAFKAQLVFCSSFPEEVDWEALDDSKWESDASRILNGTQLLSRRYLSDFTTPQMADKIFGGRGVFIGYPQEDGSVGSRFSLNPGLAMSSTCTDKDAAWSFIRELFLPQANEDHYDEYAEQYWFDGYPVNKSDFELLKECEMKEVILKDDDGQPMLDENGEPMRLSKNNEYVSNEQVLEVYAATQDDVDRTMELYNSIDALYGYDESIYNIIQGQIGAYFAGDKDLDAAAAEIQNRVQLYMGENM